MAIFGLHQEKYAEALFLLMAIVAFLLFVVQIIFFQKVMLLSKKYVFSVDL
jgi:hypothetical protein